MGTISVERQHAFEVCDRYSEALVELYNKILSYDASFSEYPSYGVYGLQSAFYSLGYVTSELIRNMLVDVNVMKTCFKNITTFDSYLADYYSETTTTNRFNIGCDQLWQSEHVDSVVMPAQPHSRCSDVRDDVVDCINSEDLDTIVQLKRHVRALRDENIVRCRAVLQEFVRTSAVEGLTAEACKNYLNDIHFRYLDELDAAAQEFEYYAACYVNSYETDFKEEKYLYILSELDEIVENLAAYKAHYDRIVSEAERCIDEANDLIAVTPSAGILSLDKVPYEDKHCVERKIHYQIKDIKEIIDNVEENEFFGVNMWYDLENDLDRFLIFAETATNLGSGYRVIQYRPQDRFNVLGLQDRLENDAGSYGLRTESYARYAISGDRARRDEAKEYLEELLDKEIQKHPKEAPSSRPEITDEVLRGWATIYYHLLDSEYSGDVSEYVATYSVLFDAEGVASYQNIDIDTITAETMSKMPQKLLK